VLVGRDKELAVLDSLVAQTTAGAGGIVLLTGEPGVGKTRLARAGTERAVGAIYHWWRFRDGKICFYRGTEDTARTQALLRTD
jgi:MoxR-like ATPase